MDDFPVYALLYFSIIDTYYFHNQKEKNIKKFLDIGI